MPLIKRYLNRKLYDTHARRYITLDGIADLVRQGVDIQVIDHESGQDLTAFTLAQVITGQQKRQSGSLPSSILANLIASGAEPGYSPSHLNDDQIEQILKKNDIPSRLEFERLLAQLDRLNIELDKLARSWH